MWLRHRSLEDVFERELHDPRIIGRLVQRAQPGSAPGRRLPKGWQANSGPDQRRCVKVRMIGEIEHLPAELDLLTLGDREEPGERGIDENRSGPEQAIVFQVAEGVRSWDGERLGIKPAISALWLTVRAHTGHQIGSLVEPASRSIPVSGEIENDRRGPQVRAGLENRRKGKSPMAGNDISRAI